MNSHSAVGHPGVSVAERASARAGALGTSFAAPRRRSMLGGNVGDLLQGSNGSSRSWRRDEVTLHRSTPIVFRMS